MQFIERIGFYLLPYLHSNDQSNLFNLLLPGISHHRSHSPFDLRHRHNKCLLETNAIWCVAKCVFSLLPIFRIQWVNFRLTYVQSQSATSLNSIFSCQKSYRYIFFSLALFFLECRLVKTKQKIARATVVALNHAWLYYKSHCKQFNLTFAYTIQQIRMRSPLKLENKGIHEKNTKTKIEVHEMIVWLRFDVRSNRRRWHK